MDEEYSDDIMSEGDPLGLSRGTDEVEQDTVVVSSYEGNERGQKHKKGKGVKVEGVKVKSRENAACWRVFTKQPYEEGGSLEGELRAICKHCAKEYNCFLKPLGVKSSPPPPPPENPNIEAEPPAAAEVRARSRSRGAAVKQQWRRRSFPPHAPSLPPPRPRRRPATRRRLIFSPPHSRGSTALRRRPPPPSASASRTAGPRRNPAARQGAAAGSSSSSAPAPARQGAAAGSSSSSPPAAASRRLASGTAVYVRTRYVMITERCWLLIWLPARVIAACNPDYWTIKYSADLHAMFAGKISRVRATDVREAPAGPSSTAAAANANGGQSQRPAASTS
ncbi:hypothetical protein BRADI_1g01593v3 [Brachypodium distachyon]|uniref:Uncharacterized protein n=1 Tax=Brachypodium distachyon TaxID=15368 RepID=A0A0Q3JII1_BRADI|nr:hypothetical protein BRADI_1g01593v3 [Brachypodium distachyon]